MTQLPPDKRPSLQQLAAQAAGAGNATPWACPRCGCTGPHDVENTYDTRQGRKRRRVCRNCKQLLRTVEVVLPEDHKLLVIHNDPELRDEAA